MKAIGDAGAAPETQETEAAGAPERDLERLALDYSRAFGSLGRQVAKVHEDMAAVKRRHMARVKAAAAFAAKFKQALVDYVDAHPDEFVKPRTRTHHGIKIGLQKGSGTLEVPNVETTVRAIKRLHPDRADQLVKTTEKPVAKALLLLGVKELAALGVSVTRTGDKVVVKQVDSEIEKMVDAYLDDQAFGEEGD